jgi:hypothetical protein
MENNNKKEITFVKPPGIKINPKEHFSVNMLRRSFDLSILVPLYLHVSENISTFIKGKEYEFSIGRASVAYSIDCENSIQLISGWVGNRQKRNIKENK